MKQRKKNQREILKKFSIHFLRSAVVSHEFYKRLFLETFRNLIHTHSLILTIQTKSNLTRVKLTQLVTIVTYKIQILINYLAH